MLDAQREAIRRYQNPLILVLLAVVCYVLFFHALGSVGFLGPDEPRYSSIAREMLLSRDFITPRLNGEPWFEKPVLMYWGAALGDAIFGTGEFGSRFPSAIAATLCVFFIYFCGRKLWGQTTGLRSALVTASSIGFLAFSRAASMDMLLSAALTMALCSFLVANNEKGSSRRSWFCAFYAFLGFGALAKGPIAFALPGLSLLGFLLSRRRLGEWKTWHPGCAWITAVIAGPWYIACTLANGASFPREFFLNHNFQRFTTNMFGHPHPFYFYLPVLLMLTFPWTFLLISAVRRRLDTNDVLLAWWIIVPMVFFSLSVSKLPGYILPVVPPIAMLCARELQYESSRLFRIGTLIEAGTMIFIGVGFGFFGSMINVDPHVDGMLIALTAFVLAAMLIVIGLWMKPRVLGVFNVLVILSLVFFGSILILPRFNATDTMRPWSIALKDLAKADQMVYLYKPQRWEEYGLQYYRFGKAEAIRSGDQLMGLTQKSPEVLCIADNDALDEVAHIANVDMKIVLALGNQTAFLAWRAK